MYSISQYSSYSIMFCPLHSSISIYNRTTWKAPLQSIQLLRKIHSWSMDPISRCVKAITAISNLFYYVHYTVVIRSVSAIFVSFTEVIICTNCESSPVYSCEERMGAQKGSKVAPWCKHCSCCNWSKGTYLGLETALCESMVPVYYLQAVLIGTHP